MTQQAPHGSPYDRGTCDSYYRRGRNPHYIVHIDGMKSFRVHKDEMTQQEIEAYNAGYDDNQAEGDFKDWG